MLFPLEASQFDTHHSFIVRYTAAEDLGLDMHTDDLDVTFNVCLGRAWMSGSSSTGFDFTGATLTFCGYMGAMNHRKASHVYHHEVVSSEKLKSSPGGSRGDPPGAAPPWGG